MSDRAIGLAARRQQQQSGRAIWAALVGSTIEFYDFNLYGLVAAIYLGKLFFPGSDPLLSTLQAFGTYFVGFAARPIGGVIFGHLGDQIGRKATMIITLALMGVGTFLIGLVPTYAQIGVAGGVSLVVLRTLQGIATGGEWSAAALLTVEWAAPRRRGLAGSFAQLGIPAGTLLSYLLLQASTILIGPDSYWGWRLPFLVSIVLVFVGLYVRLGVLETPVFARVLEERRVERSPVLAALRRDWREILAVFLFKVGQQGPSLLILTFVLTYLTKQLHFQQTTALWFTIIPTMISLVSTLYFGHLSDGVGRQRVCLVAFLAFALWGVPYYLLLGSGVGLVVVAAMVVAGLCNDAINGPQPAYFAEAFPAQRRYSGTSLGFQLASIFGGGLAPLVATSLVRVYHSGVPVGVYISVSAVVGLVGTLMLRERKDVVDLGEEQEAVRSA